LQDDATDQGALRHARHRVRRCRQPPAPGRASSGVNGALTPMPSALIVSVGGTPDPVAFTLREHRPDFVCFLASQRSVDLVGQIKSAASLPIQDEKVLVDDADDLLACYRAALDCVG